MKNPTGILFVVFCFSFLQGISAAEVEHQHHAKNGLRFSIRSVSDGPWSDPDTWQPQRIPSTGDRVLVSRGTHVHFDVVSKHRIRMVHIVGTLEFARDRNTELNVGILKVQNNEQCAESGFACEFDGKAPEGPLPALIIGTKDHPINQHVTARIRLHHFEGMNKEDTPAIACCSARMEIHGQPMPRTWIKLAQTVKAGDRAATLQHEPQGWNVGDRILITASHRDGSTQTEERSVKAIDGSSVSFDPPLEHEHLGKQRYRSEIANLTRNVIIESADPDGVRGHTVYHRGSRGGISYAEFRELGKEGVLGRYAIHYHLVADTMRGSQVLGVAITNSKNRWVTVHGTRYLVIRDCIGYQSIGHGYFLEDGTEIYNLLDRNLAIGAKRGRRLPNQVLSFDPNDGAGYWWANGKNTFIRNVSCENEEYGFRYDMQLTSRFDPTLPIVQPDGSRKNTDVRTIPIWNFQGNEAHTEGFYGMVVAANGNSQPDNAVQNQRMLDRIRSIDWTGPDRKHPHWINQFSVWNAHYAFRPHSPNMLIENVHLHQAAYGIYRPAFENHVYRNLHISQMGAEPFNRGMDDASAQTGSISVDGLTFEHGYGNRSTPLIQMSDLNLSGTAESHFRNVSVKRPEEYQDRWPLFNRGVGPRVEPLTDGVPVYVHDYFGKGRHAKIVSTAASDLLADGNKYKTIPGLTGNHAVVAEVTDVHWPEDLLDPVDDEPPATVITSHIINGDKIAIQGVSHDNGDIASIQVNNKAANIDAAKFGVIDWSIEIDVPSSGVIQATAIDSAKNRELTPHQIKLAK